MKRILLALFSLVSLSAILAAPIVDGSFDAKEYPNFFTQNGFDLGAAVSPDGKTLYLAVRAKTTGWVAVGLGSPVMNGAFMILGYVDAKGPMTSEETGKGHFHSTNPAVVGKSAITEKDGLTTLEASIPADGFVKQGKVTLIYAYSDKDDFKAKHSSRGSTELQL